jgi:hypothetical protein
MSGSLAVFIVLCVLGCGFMIVVLFEWLRVGKTVLAARHSKRSGHLHTPLYYIPGRRNSPSGVVLSRTRSSLRPRLVAKPDAPVHCVLCEEQRAYRRIAGSFVRPAAELLTGAVQTVPSRRHRAGNVVPQPLRKNSVTLAR